jgi:hypothetical protein
MAPDAWRRFDSTGEGFLMKTPLSGRFVTGGPKIFLRGAPFIVMMGASPTSWLPFSTG